MRFAKHNCLVKQQYFATMALISGSFILSHLPAPPHSVVSFLSESTDRTELCGLIEQLTGGCSDNVSARSALTTTEWSNQRPTVSHTVRLLHCRLFAVDRRLSEGRFRQSDSVPCSAVRELKLMRPTTRLFDLQINPNNGLLISETDIFLRNLFLSHGWNLVRIPLLKTSLPINLQIQALIWYRILSSK